MIVDGVDTIDVTSVDTSLVGHMYYGDNKSVLSDLFYLLRDRKGPGERFGLKERLFQNRKYWFFSRRRDGAQP